MDRLLDADHAALVEWLVRLLIADGWIVIPEATFSIRGERGSIDVLAVHPATGALLVIEVKSVMPDVQALVGGMDRKARLAPSIARERGLAFTSVSRLLVLPDDRTARRRVAAHAATLDRILPARTRDFRRWLSTPRGPLAGIMFVSGVTQQHARHRVSGSPAVR
jgi:hypothetical protein